MFSSTILSQLLLVSIAMCVSAQSPSLRGLANHDATVQASSNCGGRNGRCLASNSSLGGTGFDAQTPEGFREVVSGFIQNVSYMEFLRAKTAAANEALKNVKVSENRSTVKWDMCQTYYQGPNVTKCADIASRIVSNSSVPSPVLTFGNSSKPPMVFINGWPQTAAIWVNQFEHFCDGESATHYCVALSFMNFEPDLPWVSNKTQLTWQEQRNRWYETMTQLGLSDITLLLSEWGVNVGQQLAYEHSDLLHAYIPMETSNPQTVADIANSSEHFKDLESLPPAQRDPFPYHQVNILTSNGTGSPANYSYLQEEFRAFQYQNFRAFSPLVSMQPGVGWPYQALVDPSVYNASFTSPEDWLGYLEANNWKYPNVKSLPEGVPTLYLYGECAAGTGCPKCTKSQECVKKGEEDPNWLQAVRNHTFVSTTQAIESADLPMLDQVDFFNRVIEEFLQNVTKSKSTE